MAVLHLTAVMYRQQVAVAEAEVAVSLQDQVGMLESEMRYLKEKAALGYRDDSNARSSIAPEALAMSQSGKLSGSEIPGLVEFQKRREEFSEHERRMQQDLAAKIKVDLALSDSRAMAKELKAVKDRCFQLESELRQERSTAKKQQLLFKEAIDSIRSDMTHVRQEAVDLCVSREVTLRAAESTIEGLKLSEETLKKNVADLLQRLEEQQMKYLRVEEDTIAKYTMLAFQEKEQLEKKEKLFAEIEVQSKQMQFEKLQVERRAQSLHEQCLTLIREKEELVKAHTLSKTTMMKEREEREKVRRTCAELTAEHIKVRQDAASAEDKVAMMDRLLRERDATIASLLEKVALSSTWVESQNSERDRLVVIFA